MSAGISQATGIITASGLIGTGNTVLYKFSHIYSRYLYRWWCWCFCWAGTDKVFYENDPNGQIVLQARLALVRTPWCVWIAVASGKTITIPSGAEPTIV